jgi:diguanylate cyclase (GGDEF)-like protein/PAS domain S-box-containing protein
MAAIDMAPARLARFRVVWPFPASSGFLAFGGLLVVAYLAGEASVATTAVLYEVSSAACMVALGFGLRLRAGEAPLLSWRVLSVGVGCFALGDLLWFLRNAFGLAVGPSTLPDAAYLAGYVPLGLSLVMLSSGRRHPLDTLRRELLDAVIVFLAAFTVLWFFGLDQLVDSHRIHGSELAFSVAYPALDLLVLSILARLMFAAPSWPVAHRLLAAAFTVELVADILWRTALAHGVTIVTSWLNVMFMVAYTFFGAAALHPSPDEVVAAPEEMPPIGMLSRRRVRLLGLAAAAPVLVLLFRHGHLDDRLDLICFATAIAGIPLLTLTRISAISTEVDRFSAATREAHRELDAVIDASPVPICVVDHDGRVRVWNAAAARASDYTADEVLGRRAPLVPPNGGKRVQALYEAALDGVPMRGVHVKLLNRSGEVVETRFSTAPLGDESGSIVALFEDVSAERQQAETISFLARHDPLTSLPNRTAFENELARVLEEGDATADTLVLVDLDNFKLVNDMGGHETGDRLLVELTQRLRSLLRPSDTFARLSGDEFAILLHGADAEATTSVVSRLLEETRDYRLPTAQGVFDITMSAGVYLLRCGDRTADALRHADEALYEAKARGKNTMHLWTGRGQQRPDATRKWSPVIKDALAADRLEAFVQPVVDLSTGEPRFHEALCRLRGEDGAYIAPNLFLGHAERLGLMPAIDRRMVENAERLLREDVCNGVFVNLSPSSFDDDELFDLLRTTLAGLAPGRLGLEITERTSLRDFDGAARKLTWLRKLGARIAIDDFGLGFSSFAQLGVLPCDLIKISADLGGKSAVSRNSIVDAITTVAHAHGKAVVLEGVETAADAERARERGIEFAQGWYFGRPAPTTEPIRAARASMPSPATTLGWRTRPSAAGSSELVSATGSATC